MGKFSENVVRTFNKMKFKTMEKSPEILLVTGIVLGVGSMIGACVAAVKVKPSIDKAKNDISEINNKLENATSEEPYTEKEANTDKVRVVGRTALEVGKVMGPFVVGEICSVVCILASHGIIKKRNVALSAAYAVVDSGFKDYRKNVIDRFGEEIDKELRYNTRTEEIPNRTVDEETGEIKEDGVKEIKVSDPNVISDYSKYFDESCRGWEKNSEMNLLYLRNKQAYWTNVLRTKGYVFLNDIYEDFGLPKTKAGQVVGWIYSGKGDNQEGDDYIDFGIYELNNERKRAFVNGYERSILMDFNVQGNILDKFQSVQRY